MVLALIPDYRWLRSGHTTFFLYLIGVGFLILTLVFGATTKGAQSRFDLWFFSLQAAEPAKLILIAVLAKYFSKRHIMIGDFRQVFLSGLYALVMFLLVAVQPDFGSALILAFIWFGMTLVSGIKLRQAAVVLAILATSFALLWQFGFYDYQIKAKISAEPKSG